MVKKSKHRKKCKKEISVEMAENIRQEPESKSDDFLKKYNSICKILRIKVDENRSDINQNTHDNSIKRLSEMMKVFVKAQVNVDELVNSVNGEGFKNLKIINSEEKKFVESNFRIRSVIDEYKEGLKEINVKKKEFYLLENSGKDVSLASNKLIEHYFDRIERVKELEKDIINLKNQLQLQEVRALAIPDEKVDKVCNLNFKNIIERLGPLPGHGKFDKVVIQSKHLNDVQRHLRNLCQAILRKWINLKKIKIITDSESYNKIDKVGKILNCACINTEALAKVFAKSQCNHQIKVDDKIHDRFVRFKGIEYYLLFGRGLTFMIPRMQRSYIVGVPRPTFMTGWFPRSLKKFK